LGWPAINWLWLAVAVPIGHQLYVWAVWRTQLHNQWLTRRFGETGFRIFGMIFMLFMAARLVSSVGLALANANTLPLSLSWRWGITVVLSIPLVYTMYSVARYFGIERALGGDHFFPKYREMGMVTKGIYKYMNNAMYIFGLLFHWLPGIIWASKAALLVGVLSHLYVWAHYFTTEKPDMERIYGGS
jgi:Gpi18-like mannosyltransferase